MGVVNESSTCGRNDSPNCLHLHRSLLSPTHTHLHCLSVHVYDVYWVVVRHKFVRSLSHIHTFLFLVFVTHTNRKEGRKETGMSWMG